MSNRWKYIGFNDTWLVIIGIPFISLIMTILFFIEPNDNWVIFFKLWAGSIPYTAMYWLSLCWVICFLRKRFDRFEEVVKRIFYVVILVLIIAPYASYLLNFILEMISNWVGYQRLPLRPNHTRVLPTYFVCFFMIAVYEAIYFYYQLKESIIEKEQVKQAQIRSELEGLRNQVNPHFLFNSMNTLMNIVMEDQQLAVNFLGKLSKVYRYVLENREEQIIPLAKELDFIHSYVFLQKERFKGNLEVKIDIPDQYLEHKIIPLSLQILFENAIKHNVISRKKPLLIEVYGAHKKLIIKNNLQRKEQVLHSTKVGLENIKTRYRFFTKQEVVVKENDISFLVEIPLI